MMEEVVTSPDLNKCYGNLNQIQIVLRETTLRPEMM